MSYDLYGTKVEMDFELQNAVMTSIPRPSTSARYFERMRSIVSSMSTGIRWFFSRKSQTKEFGSINLGILETLILSQFLIAIGLIYAPILMPSIAFQLMMLCSGAIILGLTFSIVLVLVSGSSASTTPAQPSQSPKTSKPWRPRSVLTVPDCVLMDGSCNCPKGLIYENCKYVER